MKNDIYGLIPARGGSKGVPGKNVKLLGGYPLLAYTIAASKLSKNINRTIVSTDSEDIKRIALKYGAEAPFMRPRKISGDKSTDLELFEHAIKWFADNEGNLPRMFVHLRPTTPLRDPSEIDRAIRNIEGRDEATSLRSAHELSEPPQKMLKVDSGGFFTGFFPDDPRPEYYNLPRQVFPKAYHPNGYVDIIKTDFVKESGKLHGPNMLAFLTAISTEVDRPEDFDCLEYQLNKMSNTVYEYLSKNFLRED